MGHRKCKTGQSLVEDSHASCGHCRTRVVPLGHQKNSPRLVAPITRVVAQSGHTNIETSSGTPTPSSEKNRCRRQAYYGLAPVAAGCGTVTSWAAARFRSSSADFPICLFLVLLSNHGPNRPSILVRSEHNRGFQSANSAALLLWPMRGPCKPEAECDSFFNLYYFLPLLLASDQGRGTRAARKASKRKIASISPEACCMTCTASVAGLSLIHI